MASSNLNQSAVESWTDDLPVCKLSGVGFLTNQRYREDGGRREVHEFEDRHFHFCLDGTGLYGIFDGHDGSRASDFAAQRFPAELILGQLEESMTGEQVRSALRQAFITVEKGFFQSIDDALAEKTTLQLQIPEGMSSYEAVQQFPEEVGRIQVLNDEISGGTTAVVALVFSNQLYIANVGDSRALLCRHNRDGTMQIEQLSVNHDTNNEEELMRLADLGLDVNQIQRNHRVGNQENTRSIGDYCVKGGYKDFDILMMAKEEPVIAEPHICGPILVDDSFHSLILMTDGLYKALEDATDTKAPNIDIVNMLSHELQQQSTLNGLSQAIVDRVGRVHHDAFMNQVQKCQKRDDMTVLVRIFSEEITSSMKSPRGGGKKRSIPGMPPLSPGVLPVSVPYNPAAADNGNAGPSLIIPSGEGIGQPVSRPQGMSERGTVYPPSQNHSNPSSTTSTPTNVISGPSFTVSSSSGTQSSASSTSASPSTAQPPRIANEELEQQSQKKATDEIDQAPGADDNDPDKIEPYVDFSDFFKLCQEYGEDVVYNWERGV